MLHLGAGTGLQAFDLIVYRLQTANQAQFSAFAGSHCGMPAHRTARASLLNTLISGISLHIRLFAV